METDESIARFKWVAVLNLLCNPRNEVPLFVCKLKYVSFKLDYDMLRDSDRDILCKFGVLKWVI